jgi:hypothetical protein
MILSGAVAVALRKMRRVHPLARKTAENCDMAIFVLLRGGGQHPGHQQDESQSQRKEFRLNQREHDAMPTLDYHNCKRLITAAPTPRDDNTHQRGPSQQSQASIWKYNARLYGRGLSKIAHSEGRASQN